jgi:D-cysteine desulfhydrase
MALPAEPLIGSAEGVLLEPVYSGKAFAGLLASIRAGRSSAEPTFFSS